MTKYSEALSYYKKVLEIRQKASSVNQSDLACCHNNIGEHSKALSSHKQALEIRREILSSNHPDLVTSYKNIGDVYNNMGTTLKRFYITSKHLKSNK